MITSLEGQIDAIAENYIILIVNGVGYKVENSAPYRLGLEGNTVKLRTYTYVRQDEIRLFGFSTAQELQMFEKLMQVSGVGPKSALTIISHYSVAQIFEAVHSGDASMIKAKGIGNKTVAKIVIELKGKLNNVDVSDGGQAGQIEVKKNDESDLEIALTSLGFARKDFEAYIGEYKDSRKPISEQIKEVLNKLRN